MSGTPTGRGWNHFKNGLWFKRYLSDQATYPIFIIIGCATGLVAFAASRTLFSHPDVYLNKRDRGSIIRENKQEGEAHYNTYLRNAAKDKSDDDSVAIFPSLNKSILARQINPSIKQYDYEDDEDEEANDKHKK